MKKLPMKDGLVVIAVMLIAGCLDPEGSLGQFFLNPDNKEVVDGAGGLAGLFGPVGMAVGSALSATYAVGRSYFVSKKAGEKSDGLEEEVVRAKAAFDGVVDGLQTAKAHLPQEHLDILHEKLEKHIPDWVQPLITKSKAAKQESA